MTSVNAFESFNMDIELMEDSNHVTNMPNEPELGKQCQSSNPVEPFNVDMEHDATNNIELISTNSIECCADLEPDSFGNKLSFRNIWQANYYFNS